MQFVPFLSDDVIQALMYIWTLSLILTLICFTGSVHSRGFFESSRAVAITPGIIVLAVAALLIVTVVSCLTCKLCRKRQIPSLESNQRTDDSGSQYTPDTEESCHLEQIIAPDEIQLRIISAAPNVTVIDDENDSRLPPDNPPSYDLIDFLELLEENGNEDLPERRPPPSYVEAVSNSACPVMVPVV